MKETVIPVGPEMAIDMSVAMTGWVAPAMAVYLAANAARLDTSQMRADMRVALDAIDAAAGTDNAAYLAAACKVAAISNLIVYMRTRPEAP